MLQVMNLTRQYTDFNGVDPWNCRMDSFSSETVKFRNLCNLTVTNETVKLVKLAMLLLVRHSAQASTGSVKKNDQRLSEVITPSQRPTTFVSHNSVAHWSTAFKFQHNVLSLIVECCVNFYWIRFTQFQMATMLILAGRICTTLGRALCREYVLQLSFV